MRQNTNNPWSNISCRIILTNWPLALKKKFRLSYTVYNELIQHNKDMNLQTSCRIIGAQWSIDLIDGLKDNNDIWVIAERSLHQVVNEYIPSTRKNKVIRNIPCLTSQTNFTFDMASSVKEEHSAGSRNHSWSQRFRMEGCICCRCGRRCF